jgi:hypothetical protein
MKIEEVLLKEYQLGDIGKPGNVTKPGDAAPAPPAPAAPPVNNTSSNYSGKVQKSGPVGQGGQSKKALPPPNPQIMARQNELIAAGAKIKADGIPGPKTTQAEKDFGPKVDAAKGSQTAGTATTITNPAQANQNAQAAPAAAPEPAAAAANPGTPAAGVAFNQGAQDPEIARLQQSAGIQPQVSNPFAPAPAPGDAAQAAAAPAPGDAAQAAAAPSALPNPWDGKDPTKAAAWSALSPEDQKWLGNADPTDKFILARSPSKGGFVGSITPNFMKKKQPAAGQGAQPAATPGSPQAGSAFNQGAAKESADLTAMLRIAGLR